MAKATEAFRVDPLDCGPWANISSVTKPRSKPNTLLLHGTVFAAPHIRRQHSGRSIDAPCGGCRVARYSAHRNPSGNALVAHTAPNNPHRTGTLRQRRWRFALPPFAEPPTRPLRMRRRRLLAAIQNGSVPASPERLE